MTDFRSCLSTPASIAGMDIEGDGMPELASKSSGAIVVAQGAWQSTFPSDASRYSRWLEDRGSLTARLQAVTTDFSVRLVRQEIGSPSNEEGEVIGLQPGQLALLREVVLVCDGSPVVFGYSVVAETAICDSWRVAADIGSNPLGSILFADIEVTRGALQFCRIDRTHNLFRQASSCLGELAAPLWARRSCFLRERTPLLVTEVFLPRILTLLPG